MKNNTKMKIAKKYQHMLEEISAENDGLYTMTWAYSKDGYMFGSSGNHTENGYTQRELYKAIQTLQKCDCKACKKVMEIKDLENHTNSMFTIKTHKFIRE